MFYSITIFPQKTCSLKTAVTKLCSFAFVSDVAIRLASGETKCSSSRLSRAERNCKNEFSTLWLRRLSRRILDSSTSTKATFPAWSTTTVRSILGLKSKRNVFSRPILRIQWFDLALKKRSSFTRRDLT